MSQPLLLRAGFAAVAGVVRPLLNAVTPHDWRGLENIPSSGFIVVSNHISELDPLTLGHFLYNQGRIMHFLAKAEMFAWPVVGRAIKGLRQIPVDRAGGGAASLQAAQEVLDDGGVIVIYPEGTITRDPQQWPMRGKTGAARLALKTQAPVIPVGQWGVQQVVPRGGRPSLFKRHVSRLQVGAPVPLDDLRARPMTRAVLEEATERIMDAITSQVEDLRGERRQGPRFDPRPAEGTDA